MSSVSPGRSRVRTLLLWAAPLTWLGCGGGGGTDIVLPSLSVTTATDGLELDPDGYSLVIDGSQSQPIGVAATLVVERLSDGQHMVELSGVAGNCSAQGENPQTVTIRSGATTTLSFAIRCSATNGAIEVATATAGSGSDPDGFALVLDGAAWGPIGSSATTSISGVAPGSHTVGLTGLAGNCQVTGDNPRSVAVSPGQTVQVPFTVTCGAPGPSSGTLNVTTTSSGPDQDPDGYAVSLDGGPSQPIAANATLTLSNLPSSAHQVELLGVALNCSVAGANPRSVTIPAAQTATVTFAVSCSPPAAGAGTLDVTTATSGSDQDLDGYRVRVDGSTAQPIGPNTTLSLTNLSAAQHSVRLLDIAANCTVAGANPARVTVPSGGNAQVAFSVSCTATSPGTGSIAITAATSGSTPDPDGYTVRIDGGGAVVIETNGSRTIDGVSPGSRSVELTGVADNCTVTGGNRRTVTVTAGQTATATFSIACVAPTPGTGSIRVSATTSGGSQDQDGYTVSVDDGAAQDLSINGNHTFQGLTPGSHSVSLDGVATNCSVDGGTTRNVTVVAGQTAALAFQVTCVATGPSVNLRIQAMYLTQSTQRLSGNVPLVQGREAFVRVFVVASGANSARPSVRLRFFQNGTPTTTLTIPAVRPSAPTALDERELSSSWNVGVPAALVSSGMAVLAEVDPDNAVAETNEADNSFPASGTPQSIAVQSIPSAAIRFVSIRQVADGSAGSVANPSQLIDLTRRMYPLNSVQTDVRAGALTVPGPIQPNDFDQWNQILSDLNALQLADGAEDRTYYGLVKLSYGAGIIGNGFVGAPTAMGTDNPSDVRRVIAHELGHTWGQLHTPSCGPHPSSVDPAYPYRNGSIGVYGYDVIGEALKSSSLPDIMGYCENPWISDYTYQHVMEFRRSHPLGSGTAAMAQPCVLIWGRIVNGRAVLEPTFQIVTRPSLPKTRGPYTVEATAADGTRLFALSFEASPIADDPRGARHFAFAVPLDQARAARLGSLRLNGPGIQVAALTRSAEQLRRRVVPDEITARSEAGGVTLEWDAAAHPMLMVRDPDTGEVLSFARGGRARILT